MSEATTCPCCEYKSFHDDEDKKIIEGMKPKTWWFKCRQKDCPVLRFNNGVNRIYLRTDDGESLYKLINSINDMGDDRSEFAGGMY